MENREQKSRISGFRGWTTALHGYTHGNDSSNSKILHLNLDVVIMRLIGEAKYIATMILTMENVNHEGSGTAQFTHIEGKGDGANIHKCCEM